jgi:hypothetical protein
MRCRAIELALATFDMTAVSVSTPKRKGGAISVGANALGTVAAALEAAALRAARRRARACWGRLPVNGRARQTIVGSDAAAYPSARGTQGILENSMPSSDNASACSALVSP